MSSDPWDDYSARSNASSSHRTSNLFSKWRTHRDRGDRSDRSRDNDIGSTSGSIVDSSSASYQYGGSVASASITSSSSKKKNSVSSSMKMARDILNSVGAMEESNNSGNSDRKEKESSDRERRKRSHSRGKSAMGRSLSRPRAPPQETELDMDGSLPGGERRRSRSSSRTRRSRSSSQGPKIVSSSNGTSTKENRSKSRSRHRSKSRSRARSRSKSRARSSSRNRPKNSALALLPSTSTALEIWEDPSQQSLTSGGESLRDYWKRRAEESKDRVMGDSRGGDEPRSRSHGRSSVTTPSGNSNWGEKVENDDDDSGSGGGSNIRALPPSTTSVRSGTAPPPPPPREGRAANKSIALDKRARSRSRPRSMHESTETALVPVGLDRTSSAHSASSSHSQYTTPRKVDSIASALVGHTKRKESSYTPSISNAITPYAPRHVSSDRPQAQLTNSAYNSDSSESGEGDLISDLHRCLERASWRDLHHHLTQLAAHGQRDEIAAQLSLPHPREGGTALHVAAWKAPPALAVKMIRLMPPDSREMAVLQSIRDGEGNTPLHLCCGNLEFREDLGGDNGAFDNLAVLKEIVRAAPTKAWTMQNSEGDTPLHMLVSSPLCAADPTMSSNSPMPNSSSSAVACAKMAMEAVRLALTSDTDPTIGSEAVSIQERTGATPLHVALAHGAHDCVVEALLDAAPSAAMIEDSRGMLPLHWAAAFGRTGPSVVKRLIEEYPQALVNPTVDGDIPLHLAVANALIEEEESLGRGESDGKVDKNRLKIVELLMFDAGRKSSVARDGEVTSPILTTNREKLTPLHCCALFDAPPQLSKLLMKHPDANAASSMTNSFGATPLHLAAAQPGVSQSIATVLAIGTPDAAAVQDRLKRTPLHVAAQNTYATNLLIKTLAELNPEAAAVKTQRGHLPLHLAAQSQAKEPVIRALIKAYPSAAEARNKSNNTPLHDAAKYRASLGVVTLLLNAYPGALYVQNQYGNLPLHCATAYQAPSEVVQLLLKSWPEGASMQNRNQDAPLHYAAAYATSASAVRPLIEAAPAAVLLLNSSGQSPVDRAKANNAPDDIVELLEAAAEEYSTKAASDGWASFGKGS